MFSAMTNGGECSVMKRMNRREFIRKSALASGAMLAAGVGVGTTSWHKPRRVIILPLLGGNDGLNTVVPYRNDLYHQSRPTLALRSHSLLRVSDTLGFHPALEPLLPIWDNGLMTIINNVGFPSPEDTHFRARLNWHTGKVTGGESTGWTTRYHHIQNLDPMTGQLSSGKDKPGKMLLSHMGSDSFPNHAFGEQLRRIAHGIQTGSSSVFYYAALSGFDTHVDQRPQHAVLLEQYSAAVTALINNLRSSGHFKDTVILSYSEFDRQLSENFLGGTHHGSGNNVLLFGEPLSKPGFYNELSLMGTSTGSVPVLIDYRQVYASVLDQWLGSASTRILGDTFKPLALF
jgi:uncharacterized protein (DUF1501 family)